MEETDGALAARLGRAQPVAAVGLLYATVFSAFGAFVKVAAAATVIMAVLGLIATVVLFPILLGVIIGSVVAYAAPLVAVPRVWQSGRSRAVSIGLTFVLVVGCAVAGWALDFAAARAITWAVDRNPCASYRAGVTGSFGRLTSAFAGRIGRRLYRADPRPAGRSPSGGRPSAVARADPPTGSARRQDATGARAVLRRRRPKGP